ncbi:hypothetical protein ACFV0P_34985, partial [Streptomyces atroolivaceus]
AQPPSSAEIGVRDGLHGNLSQLPEVRVVPAGNSPATQVDTDEVRRALDGFGTQVSVEPPITVGAAPVTADTATPGNGPTAVGAPGTSGSSPVTAPGDTAARPAGGQADPVVDPGPDARFDDVAEEQGAASGAPENVAVDVPANSAVTPPQNDVQETPGSEAQGTPRNDVQESQRNDGSRDARTPESRDEAAGQGNGSRDGGTQGSSDEAAGQNDGTATLPAQGNSAPVATGGSPTNSAASGPGAGARPGGVPTAGGGTAPSATSPQGTRTPDGVAPVDGSPTAADDSPQNTAQAAGSTGAGVTPHSGDGDPAPAVNPATAPAVDTTAVVTGTGDPAPATDPAVDTTTAPPKLSTTGSFDSTGDVRDGDDAAGVREGSGTADVREGSGTADVREGSGIPGVRDGSGTADVKSGSTRAGNLEPTSAAPLTIVVSAVPPPGEGSPEAAELLDGAGTDRAVVLGPAVTPDGAGRPVRAAVELTREGPGAPVQVRPLTGPAPAATADGTTGTTTDTAFPGADVLLPLADALGPTDRPATESTATADSDPFVTSTDIPPSVAPPEKSTPAHSNGVGPDSTDTAVSAPDKLATLSRPWTETASEVHLESDKGDRGNAVTGGEASSPGAGHGTGTVGITPPPPVLSSSSGTSATPSVPLPSPSARVVVRPSDGGAVDGEGNGPRRPAAEPSVVTLDGLTVPLSQVRRLVPDATVQPPPGRAVHTLTISQSPAEDGTARDAGRRALIGQDTFRGVRTVSTAGSSALPPSTNPVAGTEGAPSTTRTVFTGPPAPLPGAGTGRGADYLVNHGTPRTVTLGTEDAARPSVEVSGVQLGKLLKSWAVDGDEGRPLVLYSCKTGQQPAIAGLPVAQHVANETGRSVYAPTTEVGTARDQDGEVRAVLTEGTDGPGRWRLFTPEPSGTDLDRSARDAGLHSGPGPADVFARARTLQQVRTLRDALGPDAEQRPENAELLAGLAYVDGLRWLDADSAARYGDGRMTPDLLRRMVTDWHAVTGSTTAGPAADLTPAQYTAFLRAAAGLRADAGPGTTLGELLPAPPPELPPTTLVSREDVRGLAYAPSAEVVWSLSGAPLPLSDLALGPEDTAELARRLQDPAPTDTVDKGKPTPPPLNPTDVNSYTARHAYGMPEKAFKGFRDLARDRNVVIDVRPTNPLAPKWLEAGALPKPQEIKAKTLNEVDVLLGADPESVGLVGYFKPVMPEPGAVPEGEREGVLSRFNERSTEFRELAAKMAALEAENRFVVRDGVVFGLGEDGGRRPITGDHDVFDVSTPDGTRVAHPAHDALIEEMRSRDMAVMHGAHMFWNPPTAFDKSLFDKIVGAHQGPDGEPLLRFSPGNEYAQVTRPAPLTRTPSLSPATPVSQEDVRGPSAEVVRADGLAFHRVAARGDGDCLFRAVLDSARSRDVPPAWASRSIAGLRGLVRDRVAGSELGTVADAAVPDPVFTVVDDLRIRALAGVDDADDQRRIADSWNRIAREVVTDGDAGRWQQILADSDFPQLAEIAPTPADARRLGGRGLLAAAAERPGLWSSPFADLLPDALAHTLDLDLRLVRPDPQVTGALLVTGLHPGGIGSPLYVAYNGSDHYDALVPAPEPAPDPVTPTVPSVSQEPDGSDPFGEWLRSMAGITGPDDAEAPDRGDPVPLETQLERHRPARLLTGEDARPPAPAPRTVTFEDGSRLPAVLIRPGADPRDSAPDGAAQGSPTGLLAGPGVLTLRSPEAVAREILDKVPPKVRARFDEAELLRLLTDQPSAFTAPRGARVVGREKSGVGLEMTVEAIPYHRWERFSDVGGATVRVDTMRRGQAGTGGGRSVGFGRRIAAGVGMGPPLNWLLKIGTSLGWSRRTDYSQGTAAYHQGEHRAHEGSHLHLDDVYYKVRVERVTEAPGTSGTDSPPTGTTAPPAQGPRWQRTQVHHAEFGMRDGLSWRLPDDLTVPFTGPRRAPETLTFPDGVEPRLTDSTGLYLTAPPEDVALAVSGARPGSS